MSKESSSLKIPIIPKLFADAMALVGQRDKVHRKNWTKGHAALGRAWGALLSDHFGSVVPDIPPHVVELMLVQLKTLRAARNNKRAEDDYVDLVNYAYFAYEDSKDPDGLDEI